MKISANKHLMIIGLLSVMTYLFSDADEKIKSKQIPDSAKTNKVQFEPDVTSKNEEQSEAEVEKKEADDSAKVPLPVISDPVQIYGWREKVKIGELSEEMIAKLDTGALTSSVHAENQEIFERDGKKWVKFTVTAPRDKSSKRISIQAPLVRVVRIKEPGAESESRYVVRLNFQIGDRRLKDEFTLKNRNNMLNPVLIGRSTIRDLGWVDPSRTYLANDKIMR
jgi:hypothetical protein